MIYFHIYPENLSFLENNYMKKTTYIWYLCHIMIGNKYSIRLYNLINLLIGNKNNNCIFLDALYHFLLNCILNK